MPRLHIGLPVYNGENYLSEELDSLLAQTFTDFEIIISDNGSTDATPRIAQEYAARDARVKYLRYEENQGGAWNWNNTFAHSSAELFKWASHDDMHDPHYIERCIEILDRDPQVVLCYTAARYIDGEGKPILDEEGKAIVGGRRNDGCHLRQRQPHLRLRGYLGRYPMHVLFGVARRDALARTRMMGRFASADRLLVGEIALQGQVHEIDEELFIRRLHESMSWTVKTSEHDYAVWYDPKNNGRRTHPMLQRGKELVQGIRHAKLSFRETMLCYAEVGRFIAWRHGLRGIKQKIRNRLRVLDPQPDTSAKPHSDSGAS
jgi:glycosyltransferase involved in cell wall biosynthesis